LNVRHTQFTARLRERLAIAGEIVHNAGGCGERWSEGTTRELAMSHPDFTSSQYGSFDTRAFEVLAFAFDEAWRSLEPGGVRLYQEGDADVIRQTLAKSIVDAAQQGERDPRRLRAHALHRVAIDQLR
jgi:hypothetical protein